MFATDTDCIICRIGVANADDDLCNACRFHDAGTAVQDFYNGLTSFFGAIERMQAVGDVASLNFCMIDIQLTMDRVKAKHAVFFAEAI